MSKNELTFKEYLASKEKLREAVRTTPQRAVQYVVKKYCKIPVGESKDEKVYVPLKPKHKITVEWLYTDIDNPTPLSVKIEKDDPLEEAEEFATFWPGSKLGKWLYRNAREDSSSS